MKTLIRNYLILAVLSGLGTSVTFVSGMDVSLNDKDIIQAVDRELLLDPMVDSFRIDVTARDGIVTLTGGVSHILARDRAILIAESVRGVRSVVNDLNVVPGVKRSAEEIRRDIEKVLLLDPATEFFKIRVEVNDNGMVTLNGTVHSWNEKQLSAELAKSVKGVTGLQNLVQIQYLKDRSDLDIEKEIQQVLKFDIWVDPSDVNVNVEDGKVILTGTVGGAAEKQRVVTDAWTYGVKAVNDENLIVSFSEDIMRRQETPPEVSDSEIMKAIRDAFLYDPRINSFEPEISVENGVVTLTGIVSNLMAKYTAQEDAENTVGVWRVRNFIKVRSGKAVEDVNLEDDIDEAFIVDPIINPDQLNVVSINGKVFLNGRVDHQFEKKRAESIAAREPGVVFIKNDIVVNDGWRFKTDAEIEEDVLNEYFWSLLIRHPVEVSVSNGVVTLTGRVDSPYEAEAAIDNAFQGGARSVINDLDIAWGRSNKGMYDLKYYNPENYPDYGL